ncbi:endonuclease, partial [Terribacillus saccharophilus]|nr:endonuclease [Terribacillus saccharophilus]
LSPILYKKSINPKIKKGFSECYYCYSKKNSMIEELYYLWYPNKKKTLPKAFIERYFNTRSLAIWYQDDGHLKVEKGKARKVVLSTECFTNGEISFLQYLISSKYNIFFRMDKQRRLILYNTKEIMYFLFLTRPFLYPGMDRKNLVDTDINDVLKKKRTTISLPDPIPSEKPTLFINNSLYHTEQLQDSIRNKTFYNNYYALLTSRA